MKLSIAKSSIVTMLAALSLTSFSQVVSAQSKGNIKRVSPTRVINMAYNLADRLNDEAHELNRSELKEIRKNLKHVLQVLNGQSTGGGDHGHYGEATYTSTCVTIEKTIYGTSVSRTAGTLSGGIDKMASDCSYLATSQHGSSAQMKLKDLKVESIGASTVTGSCLVIEKTIYGTSVTTRMGSLYASSLVDLDKSCKSLATAMFGSRGASRVDNIKTDI